MDPQTRRTLAVWPTAPTTPLDALRHTLAVCQDIPDTDMATASVYGPGVRTGLTWGDLRALAALIDAEPVRPSPEHSAVYMDGDRAVWSEYKTVPESDAVLPLVWAAEKVSSREDLADEGVELRIVGWIK